jgi:hypothetical protein
MVFQHAVHVHKYSHNLYEKQVRSVLGLGSANITIAVITTTIVIATISTIFKIMNNRTVKG